jgi:hypothetical protein
MANNDQQQQQKRKAVYSNSDLRSYDQYVSALGFSFFNSLGVLALSAINPDAIGKPPEAGEKIYDHENALKVYVSGATAGKFLTGIELLEKYIAEAELSEEGNDVVQPKSVTIPFGKDRTLRLMAPGASKVSVKDGSGKRVVADTSESFVMVVSVQDTEGNHLTATHILQNDSVILTDIEKEDYEITTHTGLRMLKDFLKEVVNLSTGAYRQGTLLGAPSGSSFSSGKKASPFATNSISDDDDDVEEESHETTTKAPKGNKSKVTKSLEQEFDED